MAIGASWCKDGQLFDQRKRAHPDDQNAVVAGAVVVEAVDKCITAALWRLCTYPQPGLVYSPPVSARSAGALPRTDLQGRLAAGLRPVAGAGDNQHLSFVAEAIEPGRGQQRVQENIRPLRRGAIGSQDDTALLVTAVNHVVEVAGGGPMAPWSGGSRPICGRMSWSWMI